MRGRASRREEPKQETEQELKKERSGFSTFSYHASNKRLGINLQGRRERRKRRRRRKRWGGRHEVGKRRNGGADVVEVEE